MPLPQPLQPPWLPDQCQQRTGGRQKPMRAASPTPAPAPPSCISVLMNTVNCNTFPQLLARKTSLNGLEESSCIAADALAEHYVVSPPAPRITTLLFLEIITRVGENERWGKCFVMRMQLCCITDFGFHQSGAQARTHTIAASSKAMPGFP